MKYEFNEKQQEIIRKIGYDPNADMDFDTADKLSDAASEYLYLHGLNDNGEVDDIGFICEEICDIIAYS
jgi:hypothetical protein